MLGRRHPLGGGPEPPRACPHRSTTPLCPFGSCDSGGDCECLCTAIATYAEECGQRGVHIRWRSQDLCRESLSPVPGMGWGVRAGGPAHPGAGRIQPRDPPASAALQCDGGQEYSACGPPCPQTCQNFGLELPEHCDTMSCLEGCFCPEGKVLHGECGAAVGLPWGWPTPCSPTPLCLGAEGSCIDPAECPCVWEGISFPPGAGVQQGCKNW